MYQRLTRASAETCIEIGQRTLPLLDADVRLAKPAATLRSVQVPLEAKHAIWVEAVGAARQAKANRDDRHVQLVDGLRGFGLGLLTITRNDPDAILNRRYFPDNYGVVLQLSPEELVAFAGQVVVKLAEESDPRLIAYRDPITSGRDTLAAAEAEHKTRAQARDDAYEVMEAQKLEWVRGLVASRLQATEILYGDPAEVRRCYRAAALHAGATEAEEPEPEEVVEPPDIPAAPAAADPAASPPANPPGEAGREEAA